VMSARQSGSGPPARCLEKVNRQLLALQKESWQEEHFDSRESLPQRLLSALQEFTMAVAERMAIEPAYLQRDPQLMDIFFTALQFLRVADHWGEDYRLELTREGGRQSLVVGLVCLDPQRLLALAQQRAHAVTAFSATLSPLDWSRASLGLEAGAVCRRASSPFAREQLQVSLVTSIDTRYRERQRTLPQLVACLQRWLAREPGNCIVYFPSYRYLEDCLQGLQSDARDDSQRYLWVQRRDMEEAARDALLQLLTQRRDVVALCILGGVFGEGIDLPGEQLSSIVVVGVGMPQVNRQTRQLQHWYEQHNGRGFEYAYLYPGMQKVDQALGRVVRGSQDRGKALLIDPRYREQQYRELLPPWWHYQDGMTD